MEKADWKQILSESPNDMDDVKKDQIYEHLIALKKEKIDKKNLKKLFELAQHILRYKGDMVTSLLTDLEQFSSSNRFNEENVGLLEEIEQLKRLLDQAESDKVRLKLRTKELNQENAMLLRKQEAGNLGSGEDSPDVLSEIDRQEELLSNISVKNKHIKQLLRDIECLEKQNISQTEQLNVLKINLNEATGNLSVLTNQLIEYKEKVKDLNVALNMVNVKNSELEKEIDEMEKAKIDREQEIQNFGKQIEERAFMWKKTLEEKDERLDSLRVKYDEIMEKMPGYNIDSERVELKQLTEALKKRDDLIAELEVNLTNLTSELMNSTEVINRLANEREITNKSKSPINNVKSCCNEVKILLEKSNSRCQELQDSNSSLEEDNINKTRQVMELLEALTAFQAGDDGLAKALKSNNELQHKLSSRDKQIRALIMELNALQDINQENLVLRKKLGLPEDETISTRSVAAKQRKFEKINERLTLKLRASEEMRIQLKLEKNDLRRQIQHLTNSTGKSANPDEKNEDESLDPVNTTDSPQLKLCENCLKQYDFTETSRLCGTCKIRKNCNFCENCQKKLNIGVMSDEFAELEKKYEIVIEENENLRIGMHEILQKLRDYDAESDHVVIDSSTLEKLLHALDARSISGWYHPAMRMQNELIALHEREFALKERVRLSESILTKNSQSLNEDRTCTRITEEEIGGQVEDSGDQTFTIESKIHKINLENFYEEYMINKENEIESLNQQLDESIEKYKKIEFKCEENETYKVQFNDLVNSLKGSSDEKELFLEKQYEEIVKLQTNLKIEQKKMKYSDEDYQILKHKLKTNKDQNNKFIFELQKRLIEKQRNIDSLQKHKCNGGKLSSPEMDMNELRLEVNRLKMKLGQYSSLFLKHLPSIDEKNVLKLNFDRIEKYGIIQNDSIVHFITKSEYETLKSDQEKLLKQNEELLANNKHLSDLLELHQSQLKAQQEALTKTFEEEITLRHLVVDMQSNSNEHYLIAKQHREMEQMKEINEMILRENEKLQQELSIEKQHKQEIVDEWHAQQERNSKLMANYEIKLKFLSKSHCELRQSYCQFTPLYPIDDFVKDYGLVLEMKRTLEQKINENAQENCDIEVEQFVNEMKKQGDGGEFEDKIEILKYQTQSQYLENKLKLIVKQNDELKSIVDQQKLREINWTQHWNTIQMIFERKDLVDVADVNVKNCEVQTVLELIDKSTNTDPIIKQAKDQSPVKVASPKPMPRTTTIAAAAATTARSSTPREHIQQSELFIDTNIHRSMESQLKQAMSLASTRSALLLETENRLAEAQGRIKILERIIEERESSLKELREKPTSPSRDDNVLSATINSLQNLLLEKDNTLAKYQELLRGDRQDRVKLYDDHRSEMKELQNKIDELQIQFRTKEREIELYRNKVKDLKERPEIVLTTQSTSPIKLPKPPVYTDAEYMPDKYIEDMFLNERGVFEVDNDFEATDFRNKIKEKEDEVKKLQNRLRDVSNREKMWEKHIVEKEKEVAELNEKLNDSQLDFKDISESISNQREIEQLREMLEEKDRHINDLTETLTHFHDDQQRYINDTTIHSAEQVSQLSADLNRSEATNRILNTQLEALKRQIANLSQREKQARDLVKSFKTQLIKRPVISVKSDRSTSNREDQLQKRIHQLENDLIIAKEEVRKQTNLAQSRRTKDAAELALWDKQKRFQQLSENLKQKLTERECELEKFKLNLHTAKGTISRLEREKHILENRLRSANRYCQSPSCPNLHGTKYTQAETPESYMTNDCGSSINNEVTPVTMVSSRSKRIDVSDSNQDIIEALKSRIENQQRKIVAIELDRKGGNALILEFEKLQEKLSNVESQNIRLEARNLHLQLDNDMLKQGDKEERTKRQIKHLEDYILALKSELSQAISLNALNTSGSSNDSNGSKSVTNNGQMEQTILTLRNVIERLKVENKNLKEGKKFIGGKSTITKEMYDKVRSEFEKVQQSYSESLDRISALQIELELQNITCTNCKARIEKGSHEIEQTQDDFKTELKSVKEKLIQKSQLLEKAKILLTRAAAKEKHYREQIMYWKRRCSELQNVPVIDEASE